MTIFRCFICAFIAVSVIQGVIATETGSDISAVLNDLRHRVELLEERDAAKDAKIAVMESEISEMKFKIGKMDSTHRRKEVSLQDQIDVLKKAISEVSKKEQHSDIADYDPGHSSPSTPNRIKRHSTDFRADRAIPETVAFYATHSDQLIHHLGSNQALLFQQIITNNGNAFNNNTGAFVAPIEGTYVFHATVMAIDTTDHIRAHFDIDGTNYSVFYVSDHDQSSQMLVVNLNVGQTVTIRNDFADTGFHGKHHSTFSGFLLYQTNPVVDIVGK